MIPEASERKPLPEIVLAPAPEPPKLVRLDLGCGQNPKEGFDGVDRADVKEVKYRVNLFLFPWGGYRKDGSHVAPFETDSVDEVYCSHFFEHVPARLRFAWMDELWRILKPGCRAHIIVPYYNSMRATQDPTHEWPPISEASFLYFDRQWREMNKLDHYDVKADFETVYGYTWTPEWASRSPESQAFAAKHYTNVIMDLNISMVKRPEPPPKPAEAPSLTPAPEKA